jgi:hypothetical protein
MSRITSRSRYLIVTSLLCFTVYVAHSAAIDPLETVETRVISLRARLQREQEAYIRSIALKSPAEAPSAEYVEMLRKDLRTRILECFVAGGGSEVELATKRAAVRFTLDAIHIYETTFGGSGKVKTSEWNVFTTDEMSVITQLGRDNLKEMLRFASKTPDSEISTSLHHRIKELRYQLDGFEVERSSRGNQGPPILPIINTTLTVEKARMEYQSIDDIDGNGSGKHAEKLLRLEIEHRPEDTALTAFKKRVIWGAGTDIVTGLGNKGPPWLTSGPPPPKSPIEALKTGHFDLLTSIQTRDPIGRAKAKAILNAETQVLRAAQIENFAVLDLGLAVLTDDDLAKLKDGYLQWEKSLVREQTVTNKDLIELEIQETKQHFKDIENEQLRRMKGDYIFGPPQVSSALKYIKDSVEWNAACRARDYAFKRHYALLLKFEVDRPREVPSASLRRTYEEALNERLLSEVALLNACWGELCEFERLTLLEQGGSAATTGHMILRTKRQLAKVGTEIVDRLTRIFGTEIPPKMRVTVPSAYLSRAASLESTSIESSLVTLEQIRRNVSEFHKQSPEVRFLVEDPATHRKQTLAFVDRVIAKGPGKLPEPLPNPRFDDLFPRNDPHAQTFKDLLKDLKSAPGGIVVDLALSKDFLRNVHEARIDIETGNIELFIGKTWKQYRPLADAQLARAAWSFATDGRIAAIDLRNPSDDELRWVLSRVLSQPGAKRLSNEEARKLSTQLSTLTSVNLHPALVNTRIAEDLIFCDQLVFDLLPMKGVRQEKDENRHGLALKDLRKRFVDDQRSSSLDTRENKALFYKSIIVTRSAKTKVDVSQVNVELDLAFHIYYIPIPYSKSSEWFTSNQQHIIDRVPAMNRFVTFAATVALFRSAIQQDLPNNFDELISVDLARHNTPRFTSTRSCNDDDTGDLLFRMLNVE